MNQVDEFLKTDPSLATLNKGLVNLLLGRGAEPNKPEFYSGNTTPLHLAARFGHGEVAELLVESGAVVDRSSSQ